MYKSIVTVNINTPFIYHSLPAKLLANQSTFGANLMYWAILNVPAPPPSLLESDFLNHRLVCTQYLMHWYFNKPVFSTP